MNFIRYIQQERICEHFSYLNCLPYARGMLCVNLAWHECLLRTFIEMRAKIQKLRKIRTEKKKKKRDIFSSLERDTMLLIWVTYKHLALGPFALGNRRH